MNNNQDQLVYDVIISGAGPVGLFLACELALAKCSVLILEKAEDPHSALKQLPFGMRGLNAPSVETLYRRGLLDELQVHRRLKNPHQGNVQGPRRQVGHFAGIPFLEGNIDVSQWKYRLPSSTEVSLISEMQELETVLARRAEALGVVIQRGFGVTGFRQRAVGATVRDGAAGGASSDGGTGAAGGDGAGGADGVGDGRVTVEAGGRSFQGKWLVGCDGSRSVVRKAGGFEFAGTEPAFTGYTIKVDMPDPEKLKPGRNVTPNGMYLQSQPGYVIIQDFDGGAFHGSDKPITLEHVQEVLRRVSGTDVTLSALHVATTWTDRARQATTYRNGRVLLAGDAAHIHAPLGGQGLNLGLGDAMNLGWKLAATIYGVAPQGLLDSYYAERYPIGVRVLDWSRAQAAIMGSEPHARALYAIFRDLIETRDGATYFAERVWGISTHYDIGGDHPLTGHSVPDFELEDGTRIDELMRDGHGLLLEFDSEPADGARSADGAWGGDGTRHADANASLRALANEYGDRINYVSGRAKEELGLRAVLVRPDGFIAWATDTTPDLKHVADAALRWFGRPASNR